MTNAPAVAPSHAPCHRLVLERLPALASGELQIWMRALAPLASWPAGEPARPAIERRFWRNAARGRLTETIALSIADPLGMLSADDADRELSELSRPLRGGLALRKPSAKRVGMFDEVPHTHFAQLARIDRATPEVRPVLGALLADLLAGLEAVRGPIALSFLASAPRPDDEHPEEDDEDVSDRARRVAFHVTLAGEAEIPAALRARVEALCCTADARPETWRVSRGAVEVSALRAMLRQHDLRTAPETSTDVVVAAVTIGAGVLPGEARRIVGRPVVGALPSSGVRLGRVPRPSGRLVAWRLPWETRTHHVLLIGGTGIGKSTAIKRFVYDDLEHGHGVIVVDPHGDLGADLSQVIGNEPGTLYIDPRQENPHPLDLLHPNPRLADVAIQSAMAELWPPEYTGPVFDRHKAVALRVFDAADHPITLTALDRWFTSSAFRMELLDRVDDEDLLNEARALHMALIRPSSDDLPVSNYLASKFSPFAHGPAREIFDRPDPVTWERRITRGDACVVCLPTGMLGEAGARMVGRMLLTRLGQALAAQGELPAEDRRPCSVIVDEAHLFAGRALAALYAQVRKFGGSVTAATQAPSQLGSQRDLVLSNAATVLAGRVSRAEATVLQDRAGEATVAVLPKLPRWHMVAIDAEHDTETVAPVLTPLPLPDERRAREAVMRRASKLEPDPDIAANRENEPDPARPASSRPRRRTKNSRTKPAATLSEDS